MHYKPIDFDSITPSNERFPSLGFLRKGIQKKGTQLVGFVVCLPYMDDLVLNNYRKKKVWIDKEYQIKLDSRKYNNKNSLLRQEISTCTKEFQGNWVAY